jgi:hypothetical protein
MGAEDEAEISRDTAQEITSRSQRITEVISERIVPKPEMSKPYSQWERAGPITQRSVDRNHPVLPLTREVGTQG